MSKTSVVKFKKSVMKKQMNYSKESLYTYKIKK